MPDQNAKAPQRVTFTLPPDAIEFIRSEAERSHISMADVVRRALSTEKYLKEARQGGSEVLLQDKGKQISKLVFRD
ncbi:MAG TPA: ribbon-helix-helix protein, CopG family [Phenylobacterium sp.]|nr:ribbon-helix-helix protein, CopG family [Phenylobacterium sp.]